MKKVWPSGDFSIGRINPPKGDKKAHPLGGIQRDGAVLVIPGREPEPPAAPPELSSLDDGARAKLFCVLEDEGMISEALSLYDGDLQAPLGLSGVINSHNSQPQRKKNCRGSSGITPYQKKLIKSALVILESEVGRKSLSLLTLTLPTLSPDQLELVHKNWAEMSRKFHQELTRALKRHGLPGEVVGVVEVQEKRLKKWGQVCLHWHLVFQGRASRYATWALSPSFVRDLWCRQIEAVIGAPVYRDAATRIEQVRGSLVKELGKYLTKGCKVIKAAQESGQGDRLPNDWTTCSNSLKRRVKAAVRVYYGREVENLFDRRKDLQALGYLKYRDVAFEVKDALGNRIRDVVIGCAGYLATDQWEELLFEPPEQLDDFIQNQLRKAVKAG